MRNANLESGMQHVRKVPVGDRWVTSVAWSHPTCTRRGNCMRQTFYIRALRLPKTPAQSYLACALADGSVVVTTVIQTLEPCSTSLAFLPEHNVNVTIDATDDQVFSADHRGVTSLRWISTSQPEVSLTSAVIVVIDSRKLLSADFSFHETRHGLSVDQTFSAIILVRSSYDPTRDAEAVCGLHCFLASVWHYVRAEA